MEGVVRVDDYAACAEWSCFKGEYEGPLCVGDGIAHAYVMGGALVDDVFDVVFGLGTADVFALHVEGVGKIEVVCACKVVVVFFVVKGPVV